MVSEVVKDEDPGADFTASVQELLSRVKEMFQQVEYNSAVPLLETAREQAPTDTLVSLLLADAYTFTRGPDDFEEDQGAYDRALALLDEVIEREPDNTLARLRRAAIYAILAPEEKLLNQQRQILDDARGGPYEVIAELELARRYLICGMGSQALVLYKKLEESHDWLACVLHSEQGVACAISKNFGQAREHFLTAVALTTPEAMAHLQQTSEKLIGEAYWSFWRTVDNLPSRQCQNHAWLAGLYSITGIGPEAREHLSQVLKYLQSAELGSAATVLKRQFVRQMERMFPQLAGEPEVRALKQEIEEL